MNATTSAAPARGSTAIAAAAFLVSVAVFLATVASPGAAQDAPALPLVRVDGNRFAGPGGETLMFRGFSVADPDKLEREGRWNRRLFEEARRWSANVVRLPVHPSAWRARGPEAYLELLDDGIRWAEELGLYVIMDWHSIGNLQTELFHLLARIGDWLLRLFDLPLQRFKPQPLLFHQL